MPTGSGAFNEQVQIRAAAVVRDAFGGEVPGVDYLDEDGMAFTFSNTGWPTLPAGTTVEFVFGDETLAGERTGDHTHVVVLARQAPVLVG